MGHRDIAVIQSLSPVRLFLAPQTAAHQASVLHYLLELAQRLMSNSVMPPNHLIFCHHLLLPSIFPSIRVFSNESALHIRWLKYSSFSLTISPSNEYSGIDWFDGTLKTFTK